MKKYYVKPLATLADEKLSLELNIAKRISSQYSHQYESAKKLSLSAHLKLQEAEKKIERLQGVNKIIANIAFPILREERTEASERFFSSKNLIKREEEKYLEAISEEANLLVELSREAKIRGALEDFVKTFSLGE